MAENGRGLWIIWLWTAIMIGTLLGIVVGTMARLIYRAMP